MSAISIVLILAACDRGPSQRAVLPVGAAEKPPADIAETSPQNLALPMGSWTTDRTGALGPNDTDYGQSQMLQRVGADVEAYSDKIGLGEDYISYCRITLNMATNLPSDGSVPYGVNYNTMRTWDELKNVLSARESFERAYLIRCLADTKVALAAASKTP